LVIDVDKKQEVSLLRQQLALTLRLQSGRLVIFALYQFMALIDTEKEGQQPKAIQSHVIKYAGLI
jgi:hypothetical protein